MSSTCVGEISACRDDRAKILFSLFVFAVYEGSECYDHMTLKRPVSQLFMWRCKDIVTVVGKTDISGGSGRCGVG